jgi:hypothetical protein
MFVHSILVKTKSQCCLMVYEILYTTSVLLVQKNNIKYVTNISKKTEQK